MSDNNSNGDKKVSDRLPFFKQIKKVVITLALLAILFAGGLSVFLYSYFNSAGPLEKTEKILISDGSSLSSISKQLASKNVIKHPKIFTLITRFYQSGRSMKAGEYEFAINISPIDAFKKITSGEVVIYSLTIPEGLMSFQILQLIKNAPYMTGDIPQFLGEGELLPETYDYKYGDSRQDMFKRMQKMMDKTLTNAWEKRANNLPIKTKEEALVLASIVEKETGISSERERVSAVFVNRLRKNMRLQTDPTVIYAITKGKYVLERSLRYKDLEIDSKYNTYRIYGLPPEPISNPGKAAIEATLNPISSNELYFVADGTGGHQFATNLKDHNKNVQEWRIINRRNNSRKSN